MRLLSTLLVAATLATVPASAGADPESSSAVGRAIAACVRQRMGADVEVIVSDVRIFTAAGTTVTCDAARCQAVPDPSAKTGGAIRFALVTTARQGGVDRAVRSASAEAIVSVIAPAAVASRLLTRGEVIGEDAFTVVRSELRGVALRRLPADVDVAGARAVRDIAEGERITSAMIAGSAAIRSGQEVTAVSHSGSVEITAKLIAADNGGTGSVIRVVNRESRRTLRARVLSPTLVEIIP